MSTFARSAAAMARAFAPQRVHVNPISNIVESSSRGLALRPPPNESWEQKVKRHFEYHARREADEKKAKMYTKREVAAMSAESQKSSGWEKLRMLLFLLDNLGVERSPDQIRFHDAFINACLPKIFGKEWNECSVEAMESRGFTKLEPLVSCICQRRQGKTWAVSLFCLAMMIACPGVRIAVFSTGKRASGGLMEIVNGFLSRNPEYASRIVKNAQEELFLAAFAQKAGQGTTSEASKNVRGAASTSKLLAYPSSVTGKSANTIHAHSRDPRLPSFRSVHTCKHSLRTRAS